jgi:thiol:disulfide interchange protein
MVSLLVLLLTLAFGLFLYGALQRSERRWLRIAAGLSLVALTLLGLDLVQARLLPGDTPHASSLPESWQPWGPAAIDEALAEGETVLVVFSADWCITCKVNERVVLKNPRVEAELERLGVRVFKADWTRRDDTIRAELQRHGRAGVPLYLVYDPERPGDPKILPEILSEGVLVETLRTAAGPRPAAAS